MTTRVIIADDHVLFRQGLRSLLELHPDLEVVAEVDSGAALKATLRDSRCDVVLLDLQMDRWMMDEIHELSETSAVIVLTASENAENGLRAIRLGARACVQKRFAIDTLMTAIRTVADGLVWMAPEVQALFADRQSSCGKELTTRELEIVRYVTSGMRNAQVGELLGISESTVKKHLNNIFQKLGVRDRLELTHYAIRNGIIKLLDRTR